MSKVLHKANIDTLLDAAIKTGVLAWVYRELFRRSR